MLPASIDLKSLKDIGCLQDIPETGRTLEANARLKAEFIREHYGFDVFADDTGLEVEALSGAPGVYSARYAGEPSDSTANIALLLENLKGQSNRKARFRTVIALFLEDSYYEFDGIVEGEILESAQGEKGFGYDPIFAPEGQARSFAEFSMSEKNEISHRGRAFRKLQAFLSHR